MVDVIVPIVFTTVGLVFGALGVHITVSASRRRRWPTTQGIVIGASYGREGVRYLRVRYVAPDGRTRDFQNRFGSTVTSAKPGRTVLVRVNPDNPADAVVTGSLNGGGCLGIAFLLVGAGGTLAALAVALGWLR